MNDKLVWIDCEMTGLDLEHDALIEVAALVTDYNLEVLGEGVDLVIKPPQAALEQMNDFVTTMHTSSGLITELDDRFALDVAVREEDADSEATEALKAAFTSDAVREVIESNGTIDVAW